MARFSGGRKPAEELYDLDNDPHEINNLASDPAYQEKLAELRRALIHWQIEIGDLGLMPESEIERRREEAGSDYAVAPRTKADSPAFFRRLITAVGAASEAPNFNLFMTYLADPNPSIRYWGAMGIGNFAQDAVKSASVTEGISQALADPAPAVRIAAARALCYMGHADQGLPVLEQELYGDFQWARLEAANVLDELGEIARPSLETLRKSLKDQHRYIGRVVRHAVKGLLDTQERVR